MLDVALKEWAVICDLLASGRMALLLRKGGIEEDEGAGVFRLAYERFALFPSWAHQKPEMMKEAWRDQVRVLQEPAVIPINAVADAARIWEVPSREAFERLDDLHPWSEPYVDMRFNYKPDRPLYLVALRCHVLPRTVEIENHWEYGGCKSWVPLKETARIDDATTTPAMEDNAFNAVIARVEDAFAGAARS